MHACRSTILDKVLDELRALKDNCARTTEMVTNINMILTDKYTPEICPSSLPPVTPADTLAELNELLSQEDIILRLKPYVTHSLRTSVRDICKAMLTKNLASSFTLTGMTKRRQEGKNCFLKHNIYDVLMKIISSSHLASSSRENIRDAIKKTLKGVTDWNGGRSDRRRSPTTRAD